MQEGNCTYLPIYEEVRHGHEGSLRPLLVLHPGIVDQRTDLLGPETGTIAAPSRCLVEEED